MESKYLIKANIEIDPKKHLSLNKSSCICYRPHSNIICNSCRFWTKGRVRYTCPEHSKVSIITWCVAFEDNNFCKARSNIITLCFVIISDRFNVMIVTITLFMFLLLYRVMYYYHHIIIQFFLYLIQIVFLHDYTQCPRCKSHDFMLSEIWNYYDFISRLQTC